MTETHSVASAIYIYTFIGESNSKSYHEIRVVLSVSVATGETYIVPTPNPRSVSPD